MELENLRREYLHGGLNREDLDADPIQQLELWLQQAIELQVDDPTAMVVATVSEDGQPSQRIVLIKHLDQQGMVLYTNFDRRKAREIAGNPKVSLLFPWNDIERQVKIQGHAQKISAAESLKYFLSRPRESQLAAWASEQSRPLSSRQLLLSQVEHMKEKFARGDVPLPDFWGGYRLTPETLEVWQGQASRLHDRFEYRRNNNGVWIIDRLSP